jgi:hypothetical protein
LIVLMMSRTAACTVRTPTGMVVDQHVLCVEEQERLTTRVN